MRAIELTGDVDTNHRLSATVPTGVPAGPVRLVVLVPEGDRTEDAWMAAIASDWSADLTDPSQDIYTLQDGYPLNGAR